MVDELEFWNTKQKIRKS